MRKEGKRKALAALVCGSMLTVALVGGTLAYLQDTDSDVNVMTLGNVSIEQHEYQRAEGVAHNAGEAGKDNNGVSNGVKEGDLVPFEQGQLLMPAVPANNASTDYTAEATDLFFWGDYVYSGTAGNGLWNDGKLSNQMDKFVFVENTGKTDAYFRTVIAFECPEGMEYSEGSDKEFMMNINGSDLYDWKTIGYDEIDGVRYLIMSATYQNALKPGQTSHPSLLQVVMTHNATNEDMALLGDTYEILVLSQAVQVEGFDNAKAALDAGFGEFSEDNAEEVASWFSGMEAPELVSDPEGLEDALNNGDDIVLTEDVETGNLAFPAGEDVKFNGNGNSLKADYVDYSGSAQVENVTMNTGTPSDYSNIARGGSEVVFDDVEVNSAGGGIAAVDGAQVVFNSGSVDVSTTNTSGRYNFYAEGEGTKITINGGEFSFSKTLNQKRAYIYAGVGTTVEVNGGTFGPASTRDGYTAGIMGPGTVIIKGGTFGFDPSAWVADGYQAVKDGSNWVVSAK